MLEQFCEIQFMLPKDIKHTANHYTHTHTRTYSGASACVARKISVIHRLHTICECL